MEHINIFAATNLVVVSSANALNAATKIVGIVLGVIFFGIAAFAVYMYISEHSKKDSKNDLKEEGKPNNKKIENTRLFLKDVEDIRDGIVITEGGTRFIAALKCGGYPFFTDTAEGQYHTMSNYQRFFRAVNGPMTYRSSSRTIDADAPVTKYNKRINELTEKYKELSERLERLPADSPDRADVLALAQGYAETIDHLAEQLNAIKFFSSSDTISDTYQCYVFEWQYKASEYQVEMDSDEVFNLAKQELTNMANSYIAVLADARVHAKLLSQNEMIELFRQQSKPITSEIFPFKDYDKSSFFDDIISSDSLKQKYDEVMEDFNRQFKVAYEKAKEQSKELWIAGGDEAIIKSVMGSEEKPAEVSDAV